MDHLFKHRLSLLKNPPPPRDFVEALFGSNLWINNDSEKIKLDPKIQAIIFSGKLRGEVKVLFVTERPATMSDFHENNLSGLIKELMISFPTKTAELFEKMILAMKLEAREVIILPIESEATGDQFPDVFKVAEIYRPEVIITLGSKATSVVLKSNDRLTVIHGQFFNQKYSDNTDFSIVPLFHPSILETNQNMKKTAWADMQKIMRHLKKIN